jgi:thymidylate synthase (FAD)
MKEKEYADSRHFDRGSADDPLLKDVAFNRRSFGLEESHKSPYDNGMIQIGTDGIQVRLVQGIDDESFKRTLSMAVRATKGVDITDGLPNMEGDWEEMMKGGLQTALESQVVIFAVQGASRTATHQLVRSRRAAFHQQSQRASYLGSQPEVRVPESVWNAPSHVFAAWARAIRASHEAYEIAVEADISYQDARFILPEGTTSFIMLEYPVREFLAVYAYRACSMFQWEICHIIRECGKLLVADSPWMEPYVKISCEVTRGALDVPHEDEPKNNREHHCTFQGWEEVDPQCDFLYARETNRAFRSERHVIRKKS